MRLIDADAFAEFIQKAISDCNYSRLRIDESSECLTVADVLQAVIDELKGNSLKGFKNCPTIPYCGDAVSREAVIKTIKEMSNANPSYTHTCDVVDRQDLIDSIDELPSVTPKYTDEEIDKAQAVEQAYVDKMMELAVEEIKERYSDAIGKMKKAIDEMTEIHSDGEFYIKNVDAKWIISKYLCGAEMSGGGEDGKEG